MEEIELVDLPDAASKLIHRFAVPTRLLRHLTIVHFVALKILNAFSQKWPSLEIDKEAVLFGAATHDIGKVIEIDEIYHKGKKHESAGEALLLENGIPPRLARFAFTHGNWLNEDLLLEDLLVCLADKIWKGKRVEELEEKVVKKVSDALNKDYWEVYQKLDMLLFHLATGVDARLSWQNDHEA